MTYYAKINNNEVLEYPLSFREVKRRIYPSTAPQDKDIDTGSDYFALVQSTEKPSENAQRINPINQNGNWIEQWEDVAYTPEQLKSHLSQLRKNAEYFSVTAQGLTFEITQDSKANLIALFTLAGIDDTFTADFSHAGGVTELNATQAQAVSLAAQQHIQKTYSAKKVVQAKIDDGTYTTKTEVEAAFNEAMNA